MSPNSRGKDVNFSSTRRSYPWMNNRLYTENEFKRQKRNTSNSKGTNCESEKSINDIDLEFSIFQNQKKKYKQKNKANHDISYGTSLRPPNLKNRLDKLSKLKSVVNKKKDNSNASKRLNLKRDKKLLKMVEDTRGRIKKSTYYAFNRILK